MYLEAIQEKVEITLMICLSIKQIKIYGKDTWIMIIITNRIEIKAENPPCPRTDHSFVKYKDSLYVYGGRNEVQMFSDIY